MAHPKSRISKQRKRKRRTHKGRAAVPQIATCKTTGEVHQYHRAYEVDGDLYYRGRVLVKAEEVED